MSKEILLTNKSSRKFFTSKGEFYPGTSLSFSEAEAINLLRYKNDIVKADSVLAEGLKIKTATLESKIDDLAVENAKLKEENKKLKAENVKLKK